MNANTTDSNRPSTEEGVKEARRTARAKAMTARMEMLRIMRGLADKATPTTLAEVEEEERLFEEYERLKAVKEEADREEWALMTEEERGKYEEVEEEEDE